MALGPDGSIYVTGTTYASDFPRTSGSADSGTFILKLNATGSSLLYSTVIGNSVGLAIAVDRSGIAYVTGRAGSGFPVISNALQPQAREGDAFLLKLDPVGTLRYSTFFGGRFGEDGNAIALDGLGNFYLGGGTSSPDFPTTPAAFQRSFGGGTGHGFIASGTWTRRHNRCAVPLGLRVWCARDD